MDDAGISNASLYHKIAENVDVSLGVFDVKVILHDNIDPATKSNDPEVVDIFVSAILGRIR
jgi:hypothetical protein